MSLQSFGRFADNCLNQVMSSQGDGTGTIEQNVAVQTITAATNASPNVYTLNSHGYSDGDYLFIEGETGSSTANGLRVVAEKTANTFELTDPAGTAINSDGTFGGTVTCALSFVYKPTGTATAVITRMNGFAHDATYTSAGYLGVSALTNGVELRLYTNDTLTKTLTATPVKTWLQWSLNSGVDAGNGDGGTGNQTQTLLRWSFFKGCGPIRMETVDANGDATNILLAITIRDTLTGLLGQQMGIQGHL